MDKILLMLQLQAQLNDATNGEKWVEGHTKNGRKIDWCRCIYMESAEMIDSFSWKHWKNIEGETDWDNLQIEVVDVWHFLMSLYIEEYYRDLRGNTEDLAIYIASLPSFTKIDRKNTLYENETIIMQKIEELMRLVLNKQNLELSDLINSFFDLVLMSGLDLNTLYKLYVGKNILNQFRQDHGYKNASYVKIWEGVEDNIVMKQIWERDEGLKPEQLYKELQQKYMQVIEKN